MTALLRVIGINSVILLCLLLYGHLSFYRDPGSIFFDLDRSLERQYSLYREREVLDLYNSTLTTAQRKAPDEHPAGSDTNESPKICATIITSARELHGMRHPTELAVTSAVAQLSWLERSDLDLRLYFANTNPQAHVLWGSSLARLVNHTLAINDILSPPEVKELKELEENKRFNHKSGLDYAYALRDCYHNSSAPYIAIFEGDVLFADGWLAQTLQGLQDISERTAVTEWLDMRLFNQERSVGWASRSILGNNVPWIVLGIVTTLVILHRATQYLSKRVFMGSRMLLLICVLVPIYVTLFYQAGKSSLLPPRPGVSVQNWGCCTQGLVFPRPQVPGLVRELQDRAYNTPDDIVIIEYAQKTGLSRFVLNPVQLQHMGFHSVINPHRTQKDAVWSMAFEDLKPEKLEAAHKSLIDRLYGKMPSK